LCVVAYRMPTDLWMKIILPWRGGCLLSVMGPIVGVWAVSSCPSWALGPRDTIELPEMSGGLNRSMQHWLAVYSPGFQSPRSFAGVDLGAGLPC
jgi:hypothetical protein